MKSTLFLVAFVSLAMAYTDSYNDCWNFIYAWMPYSCRYGIVSTSSIVNQGYYEKRWYTCYGTNSYCQGQDAVGSKTYGCGHDSFMCASCTLEGSVTYIRIQSDGMPYHCWTWIEGQSMPARKTYIDFKVRWNHMWQNSYESEDFDTNEKTDAILCDPDVTRPENMPSSLYYWKSGWMPKSDNWVGFSRFNHVIKNALTEDGQDVTQVMDQSLMDTCLLQPDERNGYLYANTITPCSSNGNGYRSTSQKTTACTNNRCYPADYSYQNYGWSTAYGTYGGVYGLAMDGHIIYGPYNIRGELWDWDDVDVCNGFFHTDGSYNYASTTFFPYTVGCWGPAGYNGGQVKANFQPGCSTNAAGDDSIFLQFSLIGSVLLLLFSLI